MQRGAGLTMLLCVIAAADAFSTRLLPRAGYATARTMFAPAMLSDPEGCELVRRPHCETCQLCASCA